MKNRNASSAVLFWVYLAVLASNSLFADAVIEQLEVPQNVTGVLRETAMPDLGNSMLEKLLTRYYELGLGGSDVWSKISSMRLKGTLKINENTDFELLCYQRKPDRLKMTLSNHQGEVVLGYDGEEAWQYMPNSLEDAVLMAPQEARRFIHSSVFGNYLLYPYREGKVIEYHGTVREMDTVCHRIRVVLSNGFEVEYFIDVRNYLELKIVNFDTNFNTLTTLLCEDYKFVQDFPVAHKVTSLSEDGTETSLTLSQVDFNIGLTDWIFRRPK